MPTPIYDSGAGTTPRWRVTHYNSVAGSPLIEFEKWGRTKLLSQVARWTGTSWDSSRWVPKPPMVPKHILRQVVHKLQQQEVAS